MAFGIICEYNPFHNGHLHQIKTVKSISDEPIICVMSGNFVQRGEVAVYGKYARAEMALRAGADLVLELPVPYCVASAEYFSSAGVEILYRAGADKLCFGSESADTEKIIKTAEIALSEEVAQKLKQTPKSKGSALSYFDALSEAGADGACLSNDILAVEYTKAIIKNGYKMDICPIKREGNGYGDTELVLGQFPSATALRAQLEAGNIDSIEPFVPDFVLDIMKRDSPTLTERASNSLIYYLRTANAENVDVAISDRGLIYKIVNEANNSTTYAELIERLKSGRYTTGAVKRAILYILFDIKHSDLRAPVAYTTLLGANKTGRNYLAKIRKDDRIRIVTKPADASCFEDEGAKRQFALNMRADSFYTLCMPSAQDSSYFLKKSPVIAD